MILVYTGNGKGKTSACIGQAIRAKGQGKKVVFGQFFKLADQAGEQKVLANLLNEDFHAQGPGFYFERQNNINEHKQATKDLLDWVNERITGAFMLVLDEAIYALSANILTENELKKIIEFCKSKNIHLVLSGRGAPDWLCREADMVSEITEIKHHIQNGHRAQAGIEF